MKIAVAFLGKKNNVIKDVYKKYKNITIDIKTIIYLFFLSIVFYIFAKIILKSPDIIFFATNFRQANKYEFKIGEVVKFLDMYNAKNYILTAKNESDIVKESEEDNFQIENQKEFALIDSMVDNVQDETVFFSSKPTVDITENSSNIQRISFGDMKILNYSSKRDIEFSKLFDESIPLTKKSDKILLYNTHTSESYTNSDKYSFGYTGVMRTTDANFNMLYIAKAFSANLKSKGFNVVQNTTPHDYGTYTSAYAKSRITVKQALIDMGGAGISIDVHRDAIEDLTYRPVVNVNGVQVAQCMFVMGVGTDSNKNEYWEENLKLAIKLQKIADDIYPGLFKPMIIRNSIYSLPNPKQPDAAMIGFLNFIPFIFVSNLFIINKF
jgi:stage II sporulation protein P